MNIHHELKRRRAKLGFTQEQVAERLHTTRQTISNYETGRSQPDLDTLVRLAGLYQVPVEALLYGDRRERRAVLLRRAAWGVVIGYLALLLLCSLFLLVINTLYSPEELMAHDDIALIRLRFQLMDLWYPVSRLPAALLFYSLIVLAAIDHTIPTPRRIRVRLLLYAVLFVGSILVNVPFGWIDGFTGDRWLLTLSGQATGLLPLLVDLVIWGVRLWRRKASAKAAQTGPDGQDV